MESLASQPSLLPNPGYLHLSPGIPTSCLTGLDMSTLTLITLLHKAARVTFEKWKSHPIILLLKMLQGPPIALRIIDKALHSPGPAPQAPSPSLHTLQPHRPPLCSQVGSANRNLPVKPNPMPVSVNKALPEHSYRHLFLYISSIA